MPWWTRQRAAVLRAALIAGVSLLAACAATTAGHGSRAGGGTGSPSPSASGSPSDFPSGSTSGGTPASKYQREQVQTAIGDPPTANLCSAVEASTLKRSGLTATPADAQTASACTLDVVDDRIQTRLTVEAYATEYAPFAGAGRTTRTSSGRTVYSYRYDGSDDCERDVSGTSVTFKIHSSGNGERLPQSVACRATDAVADEYAEALSANSPLPRLPLGSHPPTALDACAVLGATDLSALSTLRSRKQQSVDFDSGCQLTSTTFFVQIEATFNTVPASTRGLTRETRSGHVVWADDDKPSNFCTFTSPQGSTGGGTVAEITVSTASLRTGQKLPTGVCRQAGQLLAGYLSTAGLR